MIASLSRSTALFVLTGILASMPAAQAADASCLQHLSYAHPYAAAIAGSDVYVNASMPGSTWTAVQKPWTGNVNAFDMDVLASSYTSNTKVAALAQADDHLRLNLDLRDPNGEWTVVDGQVVTDATTRLSIKRHSGVKYVPKVQNTPREKTILVTEGVTAFVVTGKKAYVGVMDIAGIVYDLRTNQQTPLVPDQSFTWTEVVTKDPAPWNTVRDIELSANNYWLTVIDQNGDAYEITTPAYYIAAGVPASQLQWRKVLVQDYWGKKLSATSIDERTVLAAGSSVYTTASSMSRSIDISGRRPWADSTVQAVAASYYKLNGVSSLAYLAAAGDRVYWVDERTYGTAPAGYKWMDQTGTLQNVCNATAPQADIAVSIKQGASEIPAATSTRYVFTVTNNGPATAYGLSFLLQASGAQMYASVQSTPDTSWWNPAIRERYKQGLYGIRAMMQRSATVDNASDVLIQIDPLKPGESIDIPADLFVGRNTLKLVSDDGTPVNDVNKVLTECAPRTERFTFAVKSSGAEDTVTDNNQATATISTTCPQEAAQQTLSLSW